MSNALENLLALVDLGNLLGQERVAALTELDNVGVRSNPSCTLLVGASVRSHDARGIKRQRT